MLMKSEEEVEIKCKNMDFQYRTVLKGFKWTF